MIGDKGSEIYALLTNKGRQALDA